WSLADYAKRNLKGAARYISRFEHAVVRHAETLDVAGVICGHIHTPAIRQVGDILYLNCGDWADSCTAIVEHIDSRRALVRHDPVAAGPGEVEDDELAEAISG